MLQLLRETDKTSLTKGKLNRGFPAVEAGFYLISAFVVAAQTLIQDTCSFITVTCNQLKHGSEAFGFPPLLFQPEQLLKVTSDLLRSRESKLAHILLLHISVCITGLHLM